MAGGPWINATLVRTEGGPNPANLRVHFGVGLNSAPLTHLRVTTWELAIFNDLGGWTNPFYREPNI